MSKLKRMWFLQGQKCFFCERHLPADEESVDHLVPVSHGGSNHDDNLVTCCKTLNLVFGSISIKDKLRAVLQQNGKFVCPRDVCKPEPATSQPAVPKEAPAQPAAPPPRRGMVLKPDQSLGLKWPDKLAP